MVKTLTDDESNVIKLELYHNLTCLLQHLWNPQIPSHECSCCSGQENNQDPPNRLTAIHLQTFGFVGLFLLRRDPRIFQTLFLEEISRLQMSNTYGRNTST